MNLRFIIKRFVLTTAALGCAAESYVAVRADEPVNFATHVRPLFERHCTACHNSEHAESDLNLASYAATLRGGSSGKVVIAGQAAKSRLWRLVSHAESPQMPPKTGKLPSADLDVIRRWIEAGAAETAAGGSLAGAAASPLAGEIATVASVAPRALREAPPSRRAGPVAAMAVSPTHNLAAIAGRREVLLYDIVALRLVTILEFPEGVPYVLKFSRSGELLLAGGGMNGRSGRVVIWSTQTGKRMLELGEELDSVIAADISPDHLLVALGGPKRKVRVYSTRDGKLMHTFERHDDWITSVAFSPDGVLLATADRAGAVRVWESLSGYEFTVLPSAEAAVNALSWRRDARVLAAACEDGKVRLWDSEQGKELAAWQAHAKGARQATFLPDGARLLTCGRDRACKLWNADGTELRKLTDAPDEALFVALSPDESRLLTSDMRGDTQVVDSRNGQVFGVLPSLRPVLTELVTASPAGQVVAALPARLWLWEALTIAGVVAGMALKFLVVALVVRRRRTRNRAATGAPLLRAPHFLSRVFQMRAKTRAPHAALPPL